MSAVKDDGGPAFPCHFVRSASSPVEHSSGVSVRDYFAANAMPFVAGRAELDHTGAEEWAAACYEIADAMLKERAK